MASLLPLEDLSAPSCSGIPSLKRKVAADSDEIEVKIPRMRILEEGTEKAEPTKDCKVGEAKEEKQDCIIEKTTDKKEEEQDCMIEETAEELEDSQDKNPDEEKPASGYEYLEHPADIQLHAWGTCFSDALKQLVESLYNVCVDIASVSEVYSFDMSAEADHDQSLVFNLLESVIYNFNAEPYFIARSVEILELKEGAQGAYSVRLRGLGESFDEQRHPRKSDVKAPTYSAMEIVREQGHVEIFVIVDV